MPSPATKPPRLHFIANSPVKGLAVAERRVDHPAACVICVHGALDRGGSFARLVRRLTSFDVIVYDRRGYQGSRNLAPVDLAHHIEDLRALVAREAQRHPVILFGHSFGGVVTLGVALRAPSMIRLVVNYESPMAWILPREGFRPPLSDDPQAEAERFFRRIMSDREWDRLSEQQRESRRLDGPALLNDLSVVQSREAPGDVADLSVPFTYAYGDGTNAPYYRTLATELVRINPSIQTVEIDHADHAAHLKNQDQLAAIIQQRWKVLYPSA
ncbi:MAG: alpha/beta hydrolase [Acidimicrobiales bacterium]